MSSEFDKAFNDAFHAAYPDTVNSLMTGADQARRAGEELARVLAEFVQSIPSPGLIKTCTTCRESKPINQFYAQKGGKYGVMSRCKECHKERCKDRYLCDKLMRDYERILNSRLLATLEQVEYTSIHDPSLGEFLINGRPITFGETP